MKLTFKKFQYNVNGHHDAVIPVTEEGEEIENVYSCKVESEVDKHTTMTIVVKVHSSTPQHGTDQELAEHIAEKMQK